LTIIKEEELKKKSGIKGKYQEVYGAIYRFNALDISAH